MQLGDRPTYPILQLQEDLSKRRLSALSTNPATGDVDDADSESRCEVPLFSVSYLVMRLSLKFHSKIR